MLVRICQLWLTVCLLTQVSQASKVSVLVLYTEDAAARYASIDDRIQAYIDATNDSYATSNVDIRLTLAHAQQINGVDDTETRVSEEELIQNYSSHDALDDLRKGIGDFSEVGRLRQVYGADYVVLLRDIEDVGGLGYVAKEHHFYVVNPQRNYAGITYSIVRVTNSLSTFAHELGHNMGLSHSRRQVANGDDEFGVADYATGHGVDRTAQENGFVTIMPYEEKFNDAQEISVFSNPRIDCHTGTSVLPCGINYAVPSAGADATRTLNALKEHYADVSPGPLVASLRFEDTNLQTCANRYNEELITDISLFSCTSSNVEKLDGLERLSELSTVYLTDNKLSNIQPLLEIPSLTKAYLTDNNDAYCFQLDQLERKLGAGNIARPSECFPLIAVLVTVNSLLM